MAKVKLTCTRTNGRWNKNDVASFDAATAKTLTGGKNPAWKDAKPEKETGGGDTKTPGKTGGGAPTA